MANNPIVTIKMADGDIMKLELYPDKAPIAVNNFISLIKQGFYNGLTFHRVIKDQPYLDGKYAAFGKLIEGEDVLDKIAGVSTNPMDRPREDQVMEEVTVETFGVDYPEPEKM